MGGSHYIEARRTDPQAVAALLEKYGDDDSTMPSWSPAGAEWTQADELLTKIFDQLTAIGAVIAAHPLPQGATRPNIPKPHPRPERPLEVARRERQVTQMAELEAEVEEAKARWRRAQEAGDNPD